MKSSEWLEEIQNYIDSSSEISYTTSTDLFIGRFFTFDDIVTVPSLTLYEESGEIIVGRLNKQNRNIRFVIRDKNVQDVLDRAHAVYEFLIENRVIEGTNYRTQLQTVFKSPSIMDVLQSSIFIADTVIGYLVTAN